jgi:transcriptional regulator with XRE-family HTH domain
MANTKSPSLIDRHIGSRIRMRRVMIGMSQEKLGDQLGITFQQIQKYEKGTNRVGSGRLHEIGRVLGVPASFFFEGQEGGGASDKPQATSFEVLMPHKESVQLLQAFNAIPDPTVRRALVNMARALAGQAAEEVSPASPRKAVSHSS